MLTRFPCFLGKKRVAVPFLDGKGPFARFSAKIKEIPLFTGVSHGYKGGVMTQTQGPGDKDRLLRTERPLCPFVTPVLARKQSDRRDGLSPGLEDTTRTEGASHAPTRGTITCKLATYQPPLSGPYCRRETVGPAATQLVKGGCLQVAPARPKHNRPTHQHTNHRPRKGNNTTEAGSGWEVGECQSRAEEEHQTHI